MNRRKSRGGPASRTSRMRSVAAEGVYNNPHFMHAATSQVGNIVRIQTVSGIVWEGVFRTFSSTFEIVLEVAAKVENPDTVNCRLAADSVVDKLIFRVGDIISMVARDAEVDYASKDTFQTDTAISSRLNGQNLRGEEKELEPWEAPMGLNGGDTSLELEPGSNGWDANDMFRKNEQIYGVQSTYDHSLTGYTVQLQPTDSADYKEAEAKANEIANEIENHPVYKARIELENGDEEERFAAVLRPTTGGRPNPEFSKGNVELNSTNDKYVPPAKRKGQTAGKLMRSTPPPAQVGQTTPSPKGVAPPLPYIPHNPSPHTNNVTPPQPREVPREPMMHNMPPQVHMQQQQQQQQQHNVQQQQQQQQQQQPQQQPPPHQMPPQQQQQQQQQHTPMNHPRHSHTPPSHLYMQRPGPPPQQKQMNGEAKPMQQRPPRNVYPSPNMATPPPQYQQEPPKQQQEMLNNVPRHREETNKDLHKFSQDFKLAPGDGGQVPQVPPPEQSKHPIPQPTPPQQQQQPQQSVSPQQENIDKVSNTLKKSNLNPNAKEFVLNPSAKPFTPSYSDFRSPSTPTASRPHTPQTPSNQYIPTTLNGPPGQPLPVMMPVQYMMSQPQYQPQPQGNRMRKVPMGQIRQDMASQMQVAAATGQPLLAPAPMQSFVYQQGISPQAYQQLHSMRVYESPPQLQYLQPNPSNTPSPAQPPPYTPGQPQQPPPQQYQAPPPQGHPQLPMFCPLPIQTQQHMMQAGMHHYLQQPPPPQGMQVLLTPHHQPQQHGPAP